MLAGYPQNDNKDTREKCAAAIAGAESSGAEAQILPEIQCRT
jgi:hypothetical protein